MDGYRTASLSSHGQVPETAPDVTMKEAIEELLRRVGQLEEAVSKVCWVLENRVGLKF